MGMAGWILLAVAAALLALGWIPVGGEVSYRGMLSVRVRVGPLRLTVYPRKPKKRKEPPSKEKAPVPSQEAGTGETEKKPPGGKEKPAEKEKSAEKAKKKKRLLPNREQIRYSLRVLPPLLGRALRRTRRRILLSPLRLAVVFGGPDPADTAELYGKAQALISALVPALKELVRIKNDEIHLATDYDSETTHIAGEIGLTIRIGDLLWIAVSTAAGLLRWLIGFRRRAGKPERQEKQKEQPERQEKQTEQQAEAA